MDTDRQTDRQTDRYDEANIPLSKICERVYKHASVAHMKTTQQNQMAAQSVHEFKARFALKIQKLRMKETVELRMNTATAPHIYIHTQIYIYIYI